MIFASLSKIILFSFLIKLFFFIFRDFLAVFEPFFLLASLSSLFVGTFSAIYQKRLKRLLAYSAISHTGFLLLGFLVSTIYSAKALIFYLIIYGFVTVLIFSLLIFTVGFSYTFPKFIIN